MQNKVLYVNYFWLALKRLCFGKIQGRESSEKGLLVLIAEKTGVAFEIGLNKLPKFRNEE